MLRSWTSAEEDILRKCYAPGGGRFSAALRELPNRTPFAVQARIKTLKLAPRGSGRNKVGAVAATAPLKFPTPAPAPAKPKFTVVPKDAPCLPGAREHIRRRVCHTMMALSAELGLPVSVITAAVVSLAKEKFIAPKLGRLSVPPEYANSLPSTPHEKVRRAPRGPFT